MAKLIVHREQPAKPISPDLFGIFFEDINYAADGGLYAEMIRNRSFDFSTLSNSGWNAMTGWEVVQRGGGRGGVQLDDSEAIHPNNPTFAVLEVFEPGQGVGLANNGFDGVAVQAGETYDVSLFARQLYVGGRWGGRPTSDPAIAQPTDGKVGPIIARIESRNGEVLAETSLALPPDKWTRLNATLTPKQTDPNARFVLLMNIRGGVALDMISLFPQKTFKNRKNGLRADLAQAIADLKPRFVRFPGGCLVHGHGLPNMYRWKDTIGPIETRKGQPNLWRYHQSMGLGYFEYFQFCEDIGAKPLPVVPAGVCCQNAGYTGGIGQRGLPLEEMPAYIQEVLDLIEYANGPVTSTWGAKRAEAGHPEPFNLKYLGVGNEEHITPVFQERFKMIYDAVKAKHPEIVVIGTAGPFWKGDDYEEGWKFANELGLEVVDEHYYETADWFLKNGVRYDTYDRNRAKVYLGEYASKGNTLHNALAEAAYLTSLERNGDIVQFSSYAPLLAKHGHIHWYPDLIYFNNAEVFPSVNYWVQHMFGNHAGDAWVPHTLTAVNGEKVEGLFASSVSDSKTGDLILKLINTAGTAIESQIEIGEAKVNPDASVWVLTGDPASTTPGDPRAKDNISKTPLKPMESQLRVGSTFSYVSPPHSMTVVRIRAAE